MESIRIEFLESRADGLRRLTMASWSCACFVIARSRLKSALASGKLACPGIYILVGPMADKTREGRPGPELQAYIGKSDVLDERLSLHSKSESKQFWSLAFAFHHQGDDLHPGQLAELESLLIKEAYDCPNCLPVNATQPQVHWKPSETETANTFLGNAKIMLEAFGIDILSSQKPPQEEVVGMHEEADLSIPDNLQGLVNEIRSTCLDLPSTEFYSTQVPDLRAKVIAGENSRIFARIQLRKEFLRLTLHNQPKLHLILRPPAALDAEIKEQIKAAYSRTLHELSN